MNRDEALAKAVEDAIEWLQFFVAAYDGSYRPSLSADRVRRLDLCRAELMDALWEWREGRQ